jgi:hypothetical protein
MKKQVTRKLTSPLRLREVAAAGMELARGGARAQVIEIGSPTAPSTEPSTQARAVVIEIG